MKVSEFYKNIFGCKVYKVSLDAGCTCPNRDGTKGRGGCLFCSSRGSGEFASDKRLSITDQLNSGIQKVVKKASGRSGKNEHKFIAYFQNFTSTYGDEEKLIQKYREALSHPDVAGISIATRPDCLSHKIIEFISDISNQTFVQIELGLQTSNPETSKLMNLRYDYSDYEEAVNRIKNAAPKVHLVTHLIFGLPGEDASDMLHSVQFVNRVNTRVCRNLSDRDRYFGIKITELFIVSDAPLIEFFREGKIKVFDIDEYFELIERSLKMLDKTCIIHRLTGDPPLKTLVAPQWAADKKRLLSRVNLILP